MNLQAILLLIITALLLSCQSGNDVQKKLGSVDLEVSGNPTAQQHFKIGLLYLHSFEYLDARAEFIKAQQADPSCGMAYWGELMAYNHPLFNREMMRLAKPALNKMGTTKEARQRLFKTDMERDLLESVEILFGPGTKQERNNAYRKHYESLSKKYKGNHEIEAFYALSLLSSPKSEKTEKLYDKAAKISQKILDDNPIHPGALHYLIHSYDYPSHAHLAVNAADEYAKVAPDATHALHMPSHIYLALGKWNEVINSNIDSWNASVKARMKQPQKEMGYHSLSWLQYGLLQREENALATKIINDMIGYHEVDKSILARSYLVAMKGTHLEALQDWDGKIADLKLNVDGLHLTKKCGYYYLQAMQASHQGNKENLRSYIDLIAKDKYMASLNLGDQSQAMCNTAGNPSIPPNQMDIDIVTIMELELKAKLAQMDNKEQDRLKLLGEGAQLYETLSLTFGPPVIFKPVHEAYAEALMDNNQYDKALTVIEKGLETTPRKLQYFKLKQKIAMETNKPDLLKDVNEELKRSQMENNREEVLVFK